MYKNFFLGLSATAILFASCNKDDNNNSVPAQEIPYSSLTSTTNYFETFKGNDGQTSVDISGQGARISMLKEIDAYMKTGITSVIDATKLINMFRNQNTPFADAALNASDKSINLKTAQSFPATDADAERQRFVGYFNALADASTQNGNTATQGTAGALANGSGKILVDEKGFEYAQFIQKGLMGAMMLDQISNIYLGDEKQNADNETPAEGENYTDLEHYWDEAYGYLTQNEYFPKQDPNDATKYLESFLGSYVRQVKAPYGDPEAVYMSFLKGRAAVVNNDTKTREEEIAKIRTALEKSIATVAVSYLNKTKTATSDGSKFRALSEGVGFIYSLRFANNAKINKTKSDELLNILLGEANGFWDLSPTSIANVRNQIADAFGIDRETLVSQ